MFEDFSKILSPVVILSLSGVVAFNFGVFYPEVPLSFLTMIDMVETFMCLIHLIVILALFVFYIGSKYKNRRAKSSSLLAEFSIVSTLAILLMIAYFCNWFWSYNYVIEFSLVFLFLYSVALFVVRDGLFLVRAYAVTTFSFFIIGIVAKVSWLGGPVIIHKTNGESYYGLLIKSIDKGCVVRRINQGQYCNVQLTPWPSIREITVVSSKKL